MASPARTNDRSGVALLIAAAFLWSLNGLLIKIVHDEGQGPAGVTIAFYRSLFAGLFLLPFAWRKLGSLADAGTTGRRRRIKPAAVACLLAYTVMTACFVIANTQTAAANAIILQYTSTFWVFGLSPFLLGESPRRSEMVALLPAVGGIAMIFVGSASTDTAGLLNALVAGFCYGFLTMMLRRLREADAGALTVANNLGSALLLLPVVIAFGTPLVETKYLVWLVVMGVVQFGLPYYLFSLALRRVPASQGSLWTLLEPVLVPVWTLAFLGETVPVTTLAGGAVILLTLLYYGLARARRRTYADIPPAA